MTKRMWPALLLALLAGGCAAKPADILMGPYVTQATSSSAKVFWVTPTNVPAALELAPLKHPGAAQPRVDTVVRSIAGRTEVLHEALLSNLQGGQTYRYSVLQGQSRVEGSFMAPPPADTQSPIRFVICGDNRSYPERYAQIVRAVMAEGPLAFVVNTGDLVTSGTAWDLWLREFFEPSAPLLRSTVFWPVRGNHEADGVLLAALFGLSNDRALYYSFDCGNVHVTVLDSGETGGPADAAMLAWLEKDLAASKAEWKIVTYHRPTFDIREHRTTWGQEDVLPILEQGGADLVVNGHSHVYQRFRPIGPAGRKPLIHITTGGAGAPTYSISPSPILEANYAGLHHCLFEVRGHELLMTVRTPEGKKLDEMKLVKTGGLYQPEVMARALETRAAKALAFVESEFRVDFAELPKPGRPATILVPANAFPAGARVHFSSDKSCPWTIEDATFEFTSATPPDASAATPKPFALQVRAPENVQLSTGTIVPAISLHADLVWEGRSFSRDDVPVALGEETHRRLIPEPQAVSVPRAPGPIVIDGDLGDWKDIPFTAAPSQGAADATVAAGGKAASKPAPAGTAQRQTVRLAWAPAGLYVSCVVVAPGVDVNLLSPLAGDCFTVFVEGDDARSFEATRNPSAIRCQVWPQPDLGDGPAGVRVFYGRLKKTPGAVKAAWKRTDQGYNLELFIPAEALAPGRMEAGTKMGFQYLLRDGPAVLEQFYGQKREDAISRLPVWWGAIVLAEK